MNEEMQAEMLRLKGEEMLQKLQLEREIAENEAVQKVVDEMGDMLGMDQPELPGEQQSGKENDLRKFLDHAQSDQHQAPSQQNPPSHVQVETAHIHAEKQPESEQTATALDRISSTMERCMLHMADASRQQGAISLQLAASGQLPKITVPVFAGDPLQFPMWNNAFDALIDSKPVDPTTKLNYLGQYVRGEPKDVVDHYLLLGTDDAYQRARSVLKERYGDSTLVSSCLHRDVKPQGSTNCTTVCSLPDQDGREHCMIVPVWVRHRSNPGKEVLQYAILDDQSNVGFISEGLRQKLDIEGPDTTLQLTTMHHSAQVRSKKISGLEVLDFNKEHTIKLPDCFTRDEVPARRSQIPKGQVLRRWTHLAPIADHLIPYPRFTFSSKVKEVFSAEKVLQVLEQDFKETDSKGEPYSVEETKFMEILEKGVQRCEDGHYEMPLPLKAQEPNLPVNKPLAIKRWNQLSARLRKNQQFCDDYRAFMDDVIQNYAERVPTERLGVQKRVNYIPHTGVYHPRKNKIRVVFDCSAKYQGVSLNDNLLQGPNMMNSLLGVLCRFRKDYIAVTADVKSMFHQFYVTPEDRDLLRFLWWEDGNPERPVVEYRMKVHLFGAASSPGVATFGLRRAADDGEGEFGFSAADYIRTDFYVDDGLRSEPDVPSAIQLLKSSQGLCEKAGLRLHKIASNSQEVLESFPLEDRAIDTESLNLDKGPQTIERVLGIVWCIANDIFGFKIELKERPFTRRGVLSVVSSIYDPCGFLSPVMLKGKQILQELCRWNLDWDCPMPDDLQPCWERWLNDVHELEKLRIPRCFKPSNFGEIQAVELHHFSDASQTGYGQCSYIRLVDDHGKTHCTLVLGKSRVTPLRPITIPRLELAAATVSAKTSSFLRSELKYADMKEFFWTDSQVVLGYIKNEARRFHVYVANRVQLIRDHTNPDSWFYVDTTQNPADKASRGMTAQQLTSNDIWFRGPDFLWKDGVFQPTAEDSCTIDDDDPEVKRATALKTQLEERIGHLESSRLECFSTWHSAKRAIAHCLQLKEKLKGRHDRKMTTGTRETRIPPITVAEMQEAERVILRSVQHEHFHEELQVLRGLENTGEVVDRGQVRTRNAAIKKTSALFRLDPFLDSEGIIRVGGRIDRANMSKDVRHPIILPRKCHISTLLIRDCHQRTQHMGRGITHNELRQKGYWVIGGTSAVSQCISSCVICRRLRGQLSQQKMAELPEERVEPSPPFSYCAVDYFGPFLIKERRSEVKRYGVLFTCMSSRSVHLETANSLSSSAFINALRRFMNRRGSVRVLRSDQATTFVGARNELREALSEMDQERVREYLLENGCDWVPFKMNVPHASNMGGVWERQIQSVRRALEPLLKSAGSQLDDEAFRTFMTEAEAIINSRPLTTSNLCDSEAPEPLTPHHLLTAKPKIILPPPGVFQREDIYSRKWWRRVQHISNEFWMRWRKEYLQGLQMRQKWQRSGEDLQIGDIVISKENDGHRYQWPLARVISVYPSADGRVRKVKLLMSDGLLDHKGRRTSPATELDRPVNKLVRLLSAPL
ncbi:uncharacterized protein [Diadema antillarum]|uniref:uncharacterized protein n=1 Tax=Diadema antillarum TaxID=105358 RepID=UPI003A8BAB33